MNGLYDFEADGFTPYVGVGAGVWCAEVAGSNPPKSIFGLRGNSDGRAAVRTATI